MMGAWFLATAYSENLAAQISKLAAIETVPGESIDLAAQLAIYAELFDCSLDRTWRRRADAHSFPLLRRGMHGIN